MTDNTTALAERLAQEIRRVDGSHSLGAAAIAEALVPFVESLRAVAGEPVLWVDPYSLKAADMCRGDDHNGYVQAWMRADERRTTPIYLHPATVTDEDVERIAQSVATALYGEPPLPGSNSLTRAVMLPAIRKAIAKECAALESFANKERE